MNTIYIFFKIPVLVNEEVDGLGGNAGVVDEVVATAVVSELLSLIVLSVVATAVSVAGDVIGVPEFLIYPLSQGFGGETIFNSYIIYINLN